MSTAVKVYNKILKFVIPKYIKHNSTTYLSEISKAGRQLFGEKYIGTFTIDQLPELKNNECLILNLDHSYELGSHWCSMIKFNNKLYFYDSFGRKHSKIISKKYIREKIYEDKNYDSEQNVNEENCGQRSLAFLVFFYCYGPEQALLI